MTTSLFVPATQFHKLPLASLPATAREWRLLHEHHLPFPSAGLLPNQVLFQIGFYNQLFTQFLSVTSDRVELSPQILGHVRYLIKNQTIPQNLTIFMAEIYQDFFKKGYMRVGAEFHPDSHNTSSTWQSHTTGASNLWESILCVWAESVSLGQLELFRHTLNPQVLCPTMLLQSEIPAEVSGWVYTFHPQTFDKSIALVTAGWGVLELNHEPAQLQRWEFDVREHAVTNQKLTPLSTKSSLHLDHLEKQTVPKSKATQPCLHESQVKAVVDIAYKLKRCFISHLKVQWALAKGKWYIITHQELEYDQLEEAATVHQLKLPLRRKLLLSGLTVHPGKISGSPIFLSKTASSLELDVGSILVVEALLPHHLQLLKKVSGIITEQRLTDQTVLKQVHSLGIPMVVQAHHALARLKRTKHIWIDAPKAGATGFVAQA